MITGAARNTKFGANELPISTSGALTPQLGDGLILTTRIGSGGDFLDVVLWIPSVSVPLRRWRTLPSARTTRLGRSIAPGNWSVNSSKVAEFYVRLSLYVRAFGLQPGIRAGPRADDRLQMRPSVGMSVRAQLSRFWRLAISLESPGLSVLTCAHSLSRGSYEFLFIGRGRRIVVT